jgi:hypothetical protein
MRSNDKKFENWRNRNSGEALEQRAAVRYLCEVRRYLMR